MRVIIFTIIFTSSCIITFAQQSREQFMIDSLRSVIKNKETPAVEIQQVPKPTGTVKTFSPEQLQIFQEDAKKNLEELYFQINVIAYRSNSGDKKNTAIATAMHLFSSEENTVEVRSVRNPNAPIDFKKIRVYLNKLKLLAYSNVTFTTFETKISNDLTLGEDGNYYGTISFCQRFEYEPLSKSLKLVELNVTSTKSDITCKKIQIIVKHADGFGEDLWKVFFGDMTVSELN